MSTEHNIELYTLAIEGLKARVDNATDQIALYKSAIETLTGAPRRGRPRKVQPENIGDFTPAPPKPTRKRRTMSPDARKRIAEAQKKRWAQYRKEQKANAKAAA